MRHEEPNSMLASDEPKKSNIEHPSRASEEPDPEPYRPKVLVVDDHRLIADTLVEILAGAGYQAAAAYDGWEALELVPRFQPDWLLSDVLMPRMNGVELAITVRQSHPNMAILLFSGQAGVSEILSQGIERGYEFELIAKPVHPLKLIQRLKKG